MSDPIDDVIKLAEEAKTPEQKLAMYKGLIAAGQKYLTNEKFAELFEEGQKIIENETQEEISMFFMLYGRSYNSGEEKWTVMPVMFADWPPPEEIDGHKFGKSGAMKAVGASFADKFPDYMLVCITHISEAWMVERPKDSTDDMAPSEDPNRIEVAFVHALSMDRRTSWRSNKILRDEAGNRTGYEVLREDIFDPENPLTPDKTNQDYLSNAIFEGYMMVKQKKEAASGKKG